MSKFALIFFLSLIYMGLFLADCGNPQPTAADFYSGTVLRGEK